MRAAVRQPPKSEYLFQLLFVPACGKFDNLNKSGAE